MKRLALALALGSAAACQLVAGIDDRVVAPEPAADAAPEASAPEAGCAHAAPPEAPPLASEGPSAAPIVLALDLAIATALEGGRSHGFDLDGVCSTGADASTNGSCRRCGPPDEDDVDGRDDGTGALLRQPLFNLLKNGGDAGATPPASRFRLVAEISDYSGAADDPMVTVVFYRSHGEDDAGRWTTTPDSFLGPGPRTIALGYVRDRRLYVRLDPLAIDYGGAGFLDLAAADWIRIALGDAIVALPLDRPTGGTISGRWRAEDFGLWPRSN